jgi:uncharacterized protein YndB with AHSA1/START domain
MTDHSAIPSTFTLDRLYPAAPTRVFAAWADPEVKASWFAGPGGETVTLPAVRSGDQ